ncbi:MAG TPA: peptidoglycan recognition family protein [Longimicrobiales bacterium]|nr:peptidoglycan recognition family protein [Longimicrobiales bacterium]
MDWQTAASATDAAVAVVPETKVLLQLTLALGLAVVVERVVEFFKNALDLLPIMSAGQKLQGTAAFNETLKTLPASAVTGTGEEEEADAGLAPGIVLVTPATDADDGSTLRAFMLQVVAAALGLGLAMYWHVHVFSSLGVGVNEVGDHILTGLFIGGGSAPAHVLIRFLGERRISVPELEAKAAARTATVTAEDTSPTTRARIEVPATIDGEEKILSAPVIHVRPTLKQWQDIPYNGGRDVEALENVHRRPNALKKPNLIVFHHTAMSSKSTFEDVVNVIKKDRGWITAYNCVVTFDGRVHAFCRWDRYGNHAKGLNARSLGISLNGNFDTNPKDPWSNHNGRHGPTRPSDAQLDAAARVVALWTKLYDVPVRFNLEKQTSPAPGIIPHYAVAQKSCPGNMFPYEEFERLVEGYANAWETSEEARDQIEVFKLKPFVFAR